METTKQKRKHADREGVTIKKISAYIQLMKSEDNIISKNRLAAVSTERSITCIPLLKARKHNNHTYIMNFVTAEQIPA